MACKSSRSQELNPHHSSDNARLLICWPQGSSENVHLKSHFLDIICGDVVGKGGLLPANGGSLGNIFIPESESPPSFRWILDVILGDASRKHRLTHHF